MCSYSSNNSTSESQSDVKVFAVISGLSCYRIIIGISFRYFSKPGFVSLVLFLISEIISFITNFNFPFKKKLSLVYLLSFSKRIISFSLIHLIAVVDSFSSTFIFLIFYYSICFFNCYYFLFCCERMSANDVSLVI